MPVYNGRPHLEAAVQSILEQDMTDFELVVVDDGSTDMSPDYVASIEDRRVRLLRTDHAGLVAALNLGLRHARGTYLARMDADDVARSDRLRLQAEFLDRTPGSALVCSNVVVIDSEGVPTGAQRDTWSSDRHLTAGLTYARAMKPIIHPSVMVRTHVLRDLAGYRDYRGAEDRDLWLRLHTEHRIDRLQLDLLSYRIHANGVSRVVGSIDNEVSSAMAVVNWMVTQSDGVDMYADQKPLFHEIKDRLHRQMNVTVLPVSAAFAGARLQWRVGGRVSGTYALLRASLRLRQLVLPGSARRATRRAIVQASSYAQRSLGV